MFLIDKQDIQMPIKLARLYDKHKSLKEGREVKSSLNNFWKKRNMTAFQNLWKFIKDKEYAPEMYIEAQFAGLGTKSPYINSLYSERAEKRFQRYKRLKESLGLIKTQKIDSYMQKIKKEIQESFTLLDSLLKENQTYDHFLLVFWINKERFSPYFRHMVSIYRQGYMEDFLTSSEKKEFELIDQEIIKNKNLENFMWKLFHQNSKKYEFHL